ncbi:uncharacterized protein [Arachis hypogaea]|uniref:uncharacterized protein isoform X2 n=1 Tax=Arachis hypogaea TaxID=3818 RepID=UPI000DEDC7F9|nr:uncharacterized protein LOC112783719 isoform X2 [Arachis hypogaea]XP_025682548.1 uncharacterized protein LOC112783719 isoform X2 [Arachis hypogaea]
MKRRKGREEWGTAGKGKKGERRRTAPAGVTAAAPPCRTNEEERREGSSLPSSWRLTARVIAASFVGSLPSPLESRTGEGEDAGQCREEERDPLRNTAPPCVVAVAELPWLPSARFKEREARGERKIDGGGFLFERPCLHRLSPPQIRHRPPRRTTPRRRPKPPLKSLFPWVELWFSHAEFSSGACDIELPRRQRSHRRSVFSAIRKFVVAAFYFRLR